MRDYKLQPTKILIVLTLVHIHQHKAAVSINNNLRDMEFIKCHHTKPISKMKIDEKTKLDDLSLLCPNCHRIVHNKKPWLSIDKLKNILT